MTFTLELNGHDLDPQILWQAASLALNPDTTLRVRIAKDAQARIEKASQYVTGIGRGAQAVYGINTGFGNFAEVKIEASQLEVLQRNLILSHCCGVGPPLSRDLVMAMWLIRLNTMCRGNSGVRMSTVEFIIKTLAAGMLADVPARGSVGASGDLAPSAHATLAVIGEGQCSLPMDGHITSMPSQEALKFLELSPLVLGPKEGLSLINGTQTTTALALKTWVAGKKLVRAANLAAAMSIEGLRGSRAFLYEGVLKSRNQPGTLSCGSEMNAWLNESTEISQSHLNCGRVQDPYSLRCAPQVHGAIFDELARSEEVLRREINSSTDNPLLFPDDLRSVSGGNFHALYTARVSDSLSSALTTLSSISERRISLAMNTHTSGLPPFLTRDGGLNSGFMMAQVSAAALVSESKTLSFPASVDSIPTNADREDHVSMGPGAGLKALQIAENVKSVLAIEMLVAAQALDLLLPLKSSPHLEHVRLEIRDRVPFLDQDRILATDFSTVAEMIENDLLTQVVHLDPKGLRRSDDPSRPPSGTRPARTEKNL